MIKLAFSDFEFTSDGVTSKAKVIATIKYLFKNKYHDVASKQFNIKVTLKPEDKADLNKAYKYVKARLEKDAYLWAGYEATKELKQLKVTVTIFENFTEKATHIVAHNTKYIKEL